MMTFGALVLIGFGASVPVLLALRLWRHGLLARRSASAEGRIVGVSTGDDVDWPIIAFTDAAGRTHDFRSDLPQNSGAVRIGASVAVRYDPADPRRAHESGKPLVRAFHYAVWLLIGGAAAFTGAHLLPV